MSVTPNSERGEAFEESMYRTSYPNLRGRMVVSKSEPPIVEVDTESLSLLFDEIDGFCDCGDCDQDAVMKVWDEDVEELRGICRKHLAEFIH